MSPRKRSAPEAKSGELVCPECGKTFTRPASLGAHRNRAHGVSGSSKASAKTASRRTKRSAVRSRATTASATASGGKRRVRRSAANGQSGVNRDGLLRSLFPAGIPAREDAIRQVNAWLDEAERLARMR
jgi:uncharacterized C2H2 Zn-finger protein